MPITAIAEPESEPDRGKLPQCLVGFDYSGAATGEFCVTREWLPEEEPDTGPWAKSERAVVIPMPTCVFNCGDFGDPRILTQAYRPAAGGDVNYLAIFSTEFAVGTLKVDGARIRLAPVGSEEAEFFRFEEGEITARWCWEDGDFMRPVFEAAFSGTFRQVDPVTESTLDDRTVDVVNGRVKMPLRMSLTAEGPDRTC